MNSQEIFKNALAYEKKILALYLSAVDTIDDDRGKSLFKALAKDEQSHVDVLEHNLNQLAAQAEVDLEPLVSSLPDHIDDTIHRMKEKIPHQMLGDIKRALNAALALEVETSQFYEIAWKNSQGQTRKILEKFHEIEQRHVDLVQIQLDYATGNGYWFDFMEIDMED